jgi:hypothetical protein
MTSGSQVHRGSDSRIVAQLTAHPRQLTPRLLAVGFKEHTNEH